MYEELLKNIIIGGYFLQSFFEILITSLIELI